MSLTDEEKPEDLPYEDFLNEELEQFQFQLESGSFSGARRAKESRVPDEVQAVLIRSRECLALLHQSAQLIHSSRSTTSGSSRSDDVGEELLRVPERIGRFQIRELIGRGGFGIVYRAIDPGIEREVAIKIPRPEILSNAQLLERFRNEGLAVARLDHPQIVPVYECGTDAIVPYLVMPYISGQNLSQWREQNPEVSFRDLARITLQLTSGIQHAHARGIVHRDLKPGNVLLVPLTSATDGETLKFIPKITDFGLAKLRDISTQMTLSGDMLGTVNYMSPEQASGVAGASDERTDIYGLGAILYELLTGIPPYGGENHLRTLTEILHDDPRPISQVRRGVPEDLRVICQKCLERDPSRRYPTAAALAEELERYLSGKPILARPASLAEVAQKWSRRHPAMSAAIGLIGVGTVLLLGILLWFNSQLADSLRIAERERNLARQHEATVLKRAYNSDMRLGQIAWNQSDVEQMLHLLNRHVPKVGEPDLRGFGWWFLHRQYRDSSHVLGHHAGGASSVAITGDGKLAASGGEDAVIRVWSLAEKKLLGELKGHTKGPLPGLDFSPDGRRLASAGEDGTVRVWDIGTLSQVAMNDAHREWVATIKYSPSGETIASGGGDKTVRLWNAEDLTPRGELKGHTQTVRSIVFHPQESLLISASEDATLRFWNWKELIPDSRLPEGLIRIANASDWPRTLAMQSNGESFVVGLRHKEVRRYGLGANHFGQLSRTWKSEANPRCLVWPTLGGPIFGMTNTEITMAGDVEKESAPTSLRGHRDEILSLAVPGDRSVLLSGSKDGEVRVWPLADPPQTIPLWKDRPRGERALTFPVDRLRWRGGILAGGIEEGRLELIDESTLRRVLSLPIKPNSRFTLSEDGSQVVLCDEAGHISQVRVADGQVLKEWKQTGVPSYVELDSSNRILGACLSNELVLISLEDPTRQTVCPHPDKVYHVAFFVPKEAAPTQVITACADGSIRFWEMESGRLLREKLLHPNGGARTVALSLDRSILATGGMDRKVRLLRLEDLSEIAVFSHAHSVAQIGFLEKGKLLECFDGTLWLWDIQSQSLSMTFPTASHGVDCAVHPHENRIAIQHRDRITILDGSPEE